MKLRHKFLLILIFSGFLISISYALGLSGKAVSITVKNTQKNLNVDFIVKKGFGIQKHGPHEISVFSLDKNYADEKNPEDVFQKHAKKIFEIKNLKLTGVDAKEDADYLSKVNTVLLSVAAKDPVAIKAKIYYCSFADSFCSLEVIHYIPGK